MRPRACAATALLSVLPGFAAAQAPAPAPTWSAVGGLHIGGAATFSVAVGPAYVLTRQTGMSRDSKAHIDYEIVALAEPGLRGARLSLGFGRGFYSQDAFSVFSGRASFFRHWKNDDGKVYAGFEASFSGAADIPLGLRVGVFTRVSGPEIGRKSFVTIDFPIGW